MIIMFMSFSAQRVEEEAVEAVTNQAENESGDFDGQNHLESENYFEEAEMDAAQNNASIRDGKLN